MFIVIYNNSTILLTDFFTYKQAVVICFGPIYRANQIYDIGDLLWEKKILTYFNEMKLFGSLKRIAITVSQTYMVLVSYIKIPHSGQKVLKCNNGFKSIYKIDLVMLSCSHCQKIQELFNLCEDS